MSIRNLDAIFRPRSVALIGASTRPHAIGALVARNLMAGGFDGPVMPVNPHHEAVDGVLAYKDIQSLPVTPDLAVICTPPDTVPGIISELGKRGTRGAIVITAGFREAGSAHGMELEAQMLAAARPNLMRIVGPNCVGVLSTPAGLNASFAHIAPKKGHVAFVAQSGAMLTTVLDWARARDIGFSHLVSLGDMADVDFGDMLDYLATDPDTSAIMLYVEAVTQSRKFMSAARAASRLKPVIAIKAGRHAAAAKAAASHTGALAGIDGVYDAAFRRAGILRVYDLDEVFDAVETLATRPNVGSDSLYILTNGGGVGVLATDALMDQGGNLAELGKDTIEKLNGVLPATWSHGNPVDIIGDADGNRYAAALKVLTEAPGRDAILVLNCPTAVASGLDAATAIVEAAKETKRAILTNWLGSEGAEAARQIFAKAALPTYETPEKAVRGFMHLVRYRRGQETLMEVPPSVPGDFAPDDARARAIVAAALKKGPGWLGEPDVHALFECYGIPTVRSATVKSVGEATAKATQWNCPVALKIFSPDITHKSDVGGVALDLENADAVRGAGEAMLARIARTRPDARIDGFVVQEMVRRPGAFELILGMASDATFGPFLLFGHGGTAVEVIGDKCLALPPLNMALAREMMSHTRIWKLLQGYRDRPPAALADIELTLVKISQLVCDNPEISELDINPLLADEKGVIALDARIRVVMDTPNPPRLAIRPYPKQLESTEHLAGIGDVLLRPVKPEDMPAFTELFAKLTKEDVRLRFFQSLQSPPAGLLARLTQIDYDREMAFVAFRDSEVIGVSRIAADPDNIRAEFAVLVRSDLKGHGLGRLLMDRIAGYAKARGTRELFGDVLAENRQMLALCHDLGCQISHTASGIVRVVLPLAPGR